MIFSSKNKAHPNVYINIDGESISENSKTKFLGVIIDDKLCWKDHILYISGKIARGIGVILKARKYLMKDSLVTLYYSFVYPYLIYCNHVWGLACKTYMKTLVLLQKRIIRIIAGVSRRSHTDPIFNELKLLKCNDTDGQTDGQADGQSETSIPPPLPQLRCGGYKNHGMSGHQLEHWRIDGPTTKENLVTLLQGYNWYKCMGNFFQLKFKHVWFGYIPVIWNVSHLISYTCIWHVRI